MYSGRYYKIPEAGVEIHDKVVEAVQEIFSTMLSMEASQEGEIQRESKAPFKDSISGVIGLAGAYKALLAIHLPQPVALAITSSFLMMEVSEVDQDVEDAIGELANMLGGSVKAILSDKSRDIDLSLPSIIMGDEYGFQPTAKDVERYLIPMRCEAGEFCIDLEFEK